MKKFPSKITVLIRITTFEGYGRIFKAAIHHLKVVLCKSSAGLVR